MAFKKVSAGDSRAKSPANSAAWINSVSAATAHYQGQLAAGSSSGVNPLKAINPTTVRVRNLTGGDLVRGSVVQLGDDVLTDVNHRKLWYEANKPAGDLALKIAVLRGAILDGAIGDAQLIGVATAIVDVTDTDHTHARPVDNEVVAASASGGPLQLITQLTQTGEQEVAVLIGAEQQRVVLGQATDAVADTDATFAIDTITVVAGSDPRPAPVNSTQTMTVKNTFGLAIDNNGLVRAEQTILGDWEAMRPGAKGDTGAPGVSGDGVLFEFAEDMAVDAAEAFATVLNADGSAVVSSITVAETVADATARKAMAEGSGAGEVETGDIVEQTGGANPSTYFQFNGTGAPDLDASWDAVASDTSCLVLDPLEFIEAYGPYTAADGGLGGDSGTEQRGFVGSGPIIAANYDNTGLPGVYIDAVQSLVPLLVVRLVRQIDATSWEAVIVDALGSNWCERWPKQESFGGYPAANYGTANFRTAGAPALAGGASASYGITVQDGTVTGGVQAASLSAQKGELWLVGQTADHDRFYALLSPLQDGAVMRGTATANISSAEVEIDSLVGLYGPAPLPAGTSKIIAAITQSLEISAGDTLFVVRDKSLSSDMQRQWRVTVGFDVTPQLKGYAGWADQAAPLVLKSIDGDLQWAAESAGGSGDGAVLRFELRSGLGLAAYGGSAVHRASAVLVDEQGDAGTETVYINDLNETAFGLGNYTAADGTAERGYRGHCMAYSTGPESEYMLLDIEGPSETIVVQLATDMTAGQNTCTYVQRFGAYAAGKIPQQSGEGVLCINALDLTGKAGHKWFASWDTLNFEYRLTSQVKEYLVVKGVPGAVAYTDETFTMSSLTAVRGDLPESVPITVTCDPRVEVEDGEVVYAAYNLDAHATQEENRWDTGDAHNWMVIFKGMGKWDLTKDQSPGHDADGQPEWQEDMPCG